MNLSVKWIVIWIIVLVIWIITLANRPFVTINSSERWIVYTLGAVQDKILTQGFHTITPFVDDVTTIAITPQTMEVDVPVSAQGAITKDNQTMWANMTMFYRFPETKLVSIAKNFGFETIKTKASRDLNESFKQVIGQYTIFDIAQKQEEIRIKTIEWLRAKLWDYPIIIDDVKITNYDWSDAFDAQIALTMQIAQEAKQSEQALKKVEIDAQKRVKEAEANKQAEALNADAMKLKGEGIAQYNAAITSNPKNMELEIRLKQLEIEKLRVEKWNGVYVSEQNYTPIPIQNGSLLWK